MKLWVFGLLSLGLGADFASLVEANPLGLTPRQAARTMESLMRLRKALMAVARSYHVVTRMPEGVERRRAALFEISDRIRASLDPIKGYADEAPIKTVLHYKELRMAAFDIIEYALDVDVKWEQVSTRVFLAMRKSVAGIDSLVNSPTNFLNQLRPALSLPSLYSRCRLTTIFFFAFITY